MHLNDEIMAQLIDGNICEKDKEKYLKHISECKECFEIYSESIRSLESIENEKSPRRIVMVFLRKRRFIPLLMAAILLISFPFIWKAVNKSTSVQPTYELTEISVAKGMQEELILKDQTRVILDSGTTFKYPETFKNETREVFLSGEAYFEVSRNREKPFIVHAEHAIIKVLGTKFSIRAWEKSQKVKVAVAEGKVELLSNLDELETGVLVSTGQMSILPKNGQPSIPEKIDINEHLAWMKHEIVFNNTPLQEILSQLERWYDVRFSLDDGISVSDQLTIHIQNRPISEILDLIADLMELEYKIEGQNIYLY